MAATLSGKRTVFDDARLQALFFRYRARNGTATLDGAERARWLRHGRERPRDGVGGAG